MEVKIITSVDYNDTLIQTMPFFVDPRSINIEVERFLCTGAKTVV